MPQMVHVTTQQKGNLGLASPSATGLHWAEAKLPKSLDISPTISLSAGIGTSPELMQYSLKLALIFP